MIFILIKMKCEYKFHFEQNENYCTIFILIKNEMLAIGIKYVPCIRIEKSGQIFNYSGRNTFNDLDRYVQSIQY